MYYFDYLYMMLSTAVLQHCCNNNMCLCSLIVFQASRQSRAAREEKTTTLPPALLLLLCPLHSAAWAAVCIFTPDRVTTAEDNTRTLPTAVLLAPRWPFWHRPGLHLTELVDDRSSSDLPLHCIQEASSRKTSLYVVCIFLCGAEIERVLRIDRQIISFVILYSLQQQQSTAVA